MNDFQRIVDAGKGFVCRLYRDFPGPLVENPINDALRLSWDNLCGDDPTNLPLPPSTPFQGGQCVGVLYEVACFINNTFSDLVAPYGPLGGVRGRLEYVGGGETMTFYEIQCHGTQSQGYKVDPVWVVYRSSPNRPPDELVTMQVQRRVDGLPDNCGDPPAAYPSAPPPPTGGYTSPLTPITYNDGTDFNVTFNLQPPTSDGITAPPPICITVVLAGNSFKVCYPFGKLPQLQEDGGVEELLRELQEELREFKEEYDKDKNPTPPDEDPTLTPIPLPGNNGGEEDAPGLQWLLVTLTKVPEKAQFGNPTVFFAGWVTFRVNNAYTERQQLSYEKSVFKAPEGATGYGVTFTNFSEGTVVSYVTQQSQED